MHLAVLPSIHPPGSRSAHPSTSQCYGPSINPSTGQSFRTSAHPSIWQCYRPFIRLAVVPHIRPPVSLSVHPSIHPSVGLSHIRPPVYLYTCTYMYTLIDIVVGTSIRPSVGPFVGLIVSIRFVPFHSFRFASFRALYFAMYHAACKVEFQPFKRSYSQPIFKRKSKIVYSYCTGNIDL